MDGRRARPISPVLDRVPRLTRAGQRPAPVAGQLKTGWAVLLGVGWPLVFTVGMAIRPAPAQAEATAVEAVLGELVGLALLAGFMVTGARAALRQRTAGIAAVATGVVVLGDALACPLSGHHQFGLWWVAELAIVGAMLAVSVAALGRRATTSALH